MSAHTGDRQDRGQYIREQRAKELIRQSEDTLQAAVEEAEKAIAENDYDRVRWLLDDFILDAFDVHPLDYSKVSDQAKAYDRTWNSGAINTTIADINGATSAAPETIEEGLGSITTGLTLHGKIDGDATTEVPVREYRHQVGERYYRPLSNGSENVQLVDPGSDLTMSLLVGGTGSGKSTAGKTLAEDRYAHGHKVVDLIDTQRVENGLWDCENRHEELDEAREDVVGNVGVGFERFDAPGQEILMPLSERMDEAQVPYNTEHEEFVVQPFTIPASELSHRQLAMMLHHSTTTQENHLRQAYDEANRRWDDYQLRDIADLIRNNPEIGDKISDRIISSLRALQRKSYIRDKECPHALDWTEIMQTQDVVTSFSVRTVRDQADKKAVLAYLVDSMKEARDDLDYTHQLASTPPLTVLMRELHFVSPSSSNQSEQDSESTLEKYMVTTMQKLAAMHRHADVEVIADSQTMFQQLHRSVRDMFHRVFVFGHKTDASEVKKICRKKLGDTDPAHSVTSWDQPGKCMVITPDGYHKPIQMLPPRHHHIDAKSEGNGLAWRDRHLEDEEMRDPPWPGEVPTRLRFDEVAKNPIGEFWETHVKRVTGPDAFVLKEDVTEAYAKWSDLHDEPPKSHNPLHSWISTNIDVDDGQTTKHDQGDKQISCYWGVELTF